MLLKHSTGLDKWSWRHAYAHWCFY